MKSERELTRTTMRAASAKSAEATPESHVPRCRARVDTILPFCAGRLSWRHRARPSATLHEIQACPLGANLNVFLVSQAGRGRKMPRSEWTLNPREWVILGREGISVKSEPFEVQRAGAKSHHTINRFTFAEESYPLPYQSPIRRRNQGKSR